MIFFIKKKFPATATSSSLLFAACVIRMVIVGYELLAIWILSKPFNSLFPTKFFFAVIFAHLRYPVPVER